MRGEEEGEGEEGEEDNGIEEHVNWLTLKSHVDMLGSK